MLGRHHVAGPTLAGLGTNFGLSPMIGKPVAIISDARLASGDNTSIVTERLLSISGEDTLTVDRKYREPWTGQLPRGSGDPVERAAAAGRLVGRARLPVRHADHDPLVLRPRESGPHRRAVRRAAGDLQLVARRARALRERGRFQQPAASEDAVRELEDLSSPMGAFVRDRCVVGPAHEVPCDALYQAWRQWCQDHGRDRPGTTQTFGRDLRAVLPGIKVTQPRIGGDERVRMYSGSGSPRGEYNSDARVPPRANWRDGDGRHAVARAPDQCIPHTPDGWSLDHMAGEMLCAHCGEPIEPGARHHRD